MFAYFYLLFYLISILAVFGTMDFSTTKSVRDYLRNLGMKGFKSFHLPVIKEVIKVTISAVISETINANDAYQR